MAAFLAGLVPAVPAFAGGGRLTSGTAASSGQGTAGLAVLDLVVLLDESGSETRQKVADEKATVGTIIQSQLNPASRVTVIGFGGINDVTSGQVATHVVCVPTIADSAANLAYLSACYDKLHRRGERQGDDTDYAAALRQALAYLSPASTFTPPSPPKSIKVILMMTDGAVDVHRDPQYGPTPAAREAAERVAVNKELAIAKANGVQFWALGFGIDIGNVDGTHITEHQALGYLNSMAARGAPEACPGDQAARYPHATWVDNPDDATIALDILYAAAGCLGESSDTKRLPGGQSVTLHVTIPQLVSAAAISVARGSPDVAVAFTPPRGPGVTGSPAISGQHASVEVLHLASVTAADIGTWDITLTAPATLASELARATAFWQGAVRVRIIARPPSARLGQQIIVVLDVLGPEGPITNARTLSMLTPDITATGTDLVGMRHVRISPVHGQPGKWAGTFTAPGQAGTLTFRGTLKFLGTTAGYGLYVTQVPRSVMVGANTPGFLARWRLVFLSALIALAVIAAILMWRIRGDGEKGGAARAEARRLSAGPATESGRPAEADVPFGRGDYRATPEHGGYQQQLPAILTQPPDKTATAGTAHAPPDGAPSDPQAVPEPGAEEVPHAPGGQDSVTADRASEIIAAIENDIARLRSDELASQSNPAQPARQAPSASPGPEQVSVVARDILHSAISGIQAPQGSLAVGAPDVEALTAEIVKAVQKAILREAGSQLVMAAIREMMSDQASMDILRRIAGSPDPPDEVVGNVANQMQPAADAKRSINWELIAAAALLAVACGVGVPLLAGATAELILTNEIAIAALVVTIIILRKTG